MTKGAKEVLLTVKDLAETYGVSRSTVLRHVKKCFGNDEAKQGRPLQFNAVMMQEFADYMGKLGKSKPRQTSSNDEVLNELKVTVARLEERTKSLERENSLLLERLEVADAALEREQMQARSFWSKLGQKLLGN